MMKFAPLRTIDSGMSISTKSLVNVFSKRPALLTSQTVSRFSPGAGVAPPVEIAEDPATQIVPEASIYPAVATSSPDVPRRNSQSFIPCGLRAAINPSLPPSDKDETSGEVVVSTVPIRKIPFVVHRNIIEGFRRCLVRLILMSGPCHGRSLRSFPVC